MSNEKVPNVTGQPPPSNNVTDHPPCSISSMSMSALSNFLKRERDFSMNEMRFQTQYQCMQDPASLPNLIGDVIRDYVRERRENREASAHPQIGLSLSMPMSSQNEVSPHEQECDNLSESSLVSLLADDDDNSQCASPGRGKPVHKGQTLDSDDDDSNYIDFGDPDDYDDEAPPTVHKNEIMRDIETLCNIEARNLPTMSSSSSLNITVNQGEPTPTTQSPPKSFLEQDEPESTLEILMSLEESAAPPQSQESQSPEHESFPHSPHSSGGGDEDINMEVGKEPESTVEKSLSRETPVVPLSGFSEQSPGQNESPLDAESSGASSVDDNYKGDENQYKMETSVTSQPVSPEKTAPLSVFRENHSQEDIPDESLSPIPSPLLEPSFLNNNAIDKNEEPESRTTIEIMRGMETCHIEVRHSKTISSSSSLLINGNPDDDNDGVKTTSGDDESMSNELLSQSQSSEQQSHPHSPCVDVSTSGGCDKGITTVEKSMSLKIVPVPQPAIQITLLKSTREQNELNGCPSTTATLLQTSSQSDNKRRASKLKSVLPSSLSSYTCDRRGTLRPRQNLPPLPGPSSGGRGLGFIPTPRQNENDSSDEDGETFDRPPPPPRPPSPPPQIKKKYSDHKSQNFHLRKEDPSYTLNVPKTTLSDRQRSVILQFADSPTTLLNIAVDRITTRDRDPERKRRIVAQREAPSEPRRGRRPNKPWTCEWETCRKAFSDIGAYELHMRHHLDERKYKCKKCERRFNSHGDLVRHEQTHLDRKDRWRYCCRDRDCLKTFMRGTELNEHTAATNCRTGRYHIEIPTSKQWIYKKNKHATNMNDTSSEEEVRGFKRLDYKKVKQIPKKPAKVRKFRKRKTVKLTTNDMFMDENDDEENESNGDDADEKKKMKKKKSKTNIATKRSKKTCNNKRREKKTESRFGRRYSSRKFQTNPKDDSFTSCTSDEEDGDSN